MRAVIYTRQSQDRDGNELAVARQLAECEKVAADRGWDVIVRLAENDTSATKKVGRPRYDELKVLMRAGAVDVVVVWHIDRLVRRTRDMEDVIDLVEQTGIGIATVTGDIDLTTDQGRLMGRVLVAFAQGEGERKAARQRSEHKQSAERGDPPRKHVFGYTRDGLTVVEPEAVAIRTAYASLLAGQTLAKIVNDLNAAGFTSGRGNPWERGAVRAMLRSPRYCAVRVMKDVEIGPGRWPAIVDRETWGAARAVLADPARVSNRAGPARKHVGSGLYRCGVCDSPVRVSGEDGEPYYACRKSGCVSRKVATIDAHVQETLVERLSRPDAAELLAVDAPDLADQQAQETAFMQQLDTFAADYADGLLTGQQLKAATDRVTARLTAVREKLAVAASRSALAAMVLSDDVATRWAGLDLNTRRAVVEGLCTVRLLSSGPGRRPFRPSTVEIAWRS